MPSAIDIANRALLQMGARANISSFSEGSTESNAVSILYQPTFEQLARSAHWNCLRAQAGLSLLKAAQATPENPLGTTLPLPPQPWLYEYLYPVNCLKLRYILPTFSTATTAGSVPMTTVNNLSMTSYPSSIGQLPFAVNYDTDTSGNPYVGILANTSGAQAVYTVNQPNPQIWDSQFQAGFVAALAAFLIPALAMNLSMLKMQVASADRIISGARVSDGNEFYAVQDHTPDWISARGGGSGMSQAFWNAGYDEMAWPVVT